ncbi:MAG: Putative oxidoreductase [uncultured Rubrobacteraceae bacterium]|uniref:Oxidoreductase n=1 Tax=uncultured Rubrobacteraceae bacterium TaxID=349277 RepID=A0A6J4NP17_9ACTN|nr:MAG: Putative oxidoreductase [uncultured Rubrobacteraceae bacterium]
METVGIGSTLESLRAGLKGTAYAAGEEGYDEASRAWNLSAHQEPAVVVMAEGAVDVIAAVRFARDLGVGVGVMATGHGLGAPCDGGVLVNTSRMRGVRVDPVARTARVEAGALWTDVIPEAQAHGLAGLVGSSSHVGVVGYTMGGGFGWLGRRYGLNAASVLEADVVTADGELLRVSAGEHPDLFWGLGGGGGNFGIVTSLEFRLYPITAVYGGNVFYPIEKAREVLELYARWSADLPQEMTTAVTFLNVPPLPDIPEPLRGGSFVVVRGCYSGENPEDGEELFRPARMGIGDPVMDTFGVMPVAAMDAISMDPVDPIASVQHSEMLRDLSSGAIDALVEVAGPDSGSPLILLEIRQLGGALARVPERLSPMGGGKAGFIMNGVGAAFTPEMAEGVKAHLARVGEATREHQTGETYVNFMELDAAGEERVRAAYPTEDFERLVALKDRRDPDNLFRFNRNIAPTRDAK